MKMKIIVIGAVAAGTSAAAKARRNDEGAGITVYERDRFISYSGCGMPYYLAGELADFGELVPRDPQFFKGKYNVDIHTQHEVQSIDTANKTVWVRNLLNGEQFTDGYDKLIIATGAIAAVPAGLDISREHVFTLRSVGDIAAIKEYIDTKKPKSAAIIGTGFIGMEMCESLRALGLSVTLIERLDHVTPGLDADMAAYVQSHLEKNGVRVITGAAAKAITAGGVAFENGEEIAAELLLIAAGVRPNVRLAAEAGLVIGATGAIAVNERMQTSDPDVYACGDCAEQFDLVTGVPVWRPLGSTANKTGRIAGDACTGGDLAFRGILGTGIFRVFGMAVAQTGLTEREARERGFEPVVCHNIKPDRPAYMGGRELVIKAVADKADGRVLGAQIVGFGGVDKRIDVFATAITFGAKAEDLFHLDLAYAPPFSTTKDPVMYTGMILENALHRGRELITPARLEALMRSGEPYRLIDARAGKQYEKGHIDTAQSIPHDRLREQADTLERDIPAVTYCNKGVTGNAAQNILLGREFKRVYNLSGGYKNYQAYLANLANLNASKETGGKHE